MQPERVVALMGGLLIGGLCGLIPFFVGRKKNRVNLGVIGLNACAVSGLILGILMALPVAIVFTIIIVLSSRKSTEPPPILPPDPPRTMNTTWHYAQADGNVCGPISEEQLRTLIGSGFLRPDDRVWRKGMTEWAYIQATTELANAILPFSQSTKTGALNTNSVETPALGSDNRKKPGFFDGSLGCFLTALAMMLGAVIVAAIKRFLLE